MFDPVAARVAAACLRDQDHLAHEVFLDNDGCFCTAGAYLGALYGRDEVLMLLPDKIILALNDLVEGLMLADPSLTCPPQVYSWNDYRRHTPEDAARLLERAAELWASGGTDARL
jgi:hypothetical protein